MTTIVEWSATVLFAGLGVIAVLLPAGVVLLTLWDAFWACVSRIEPATPKTRKTSYDA